MEQPIVSLVTEENTSSIRLRRSFMDSRTDAIFCLCAAFGDLEFAVFWKSVASLTRFPNSLMS